MILVIIEEESENYPVQSVIEGDEAITHDTEEFLNTRRNNVPELPFDSSNSQLQTSGQSCPIPAKRRSKRIHAGVHTNPCHLPRSICN